MISIFLSLLFFWNAIQLSQGEVSIVDKQILVDFYESTQGEGWTNSNNWGSGDPCISKWLGVSCSEDDSEIVSLEMKGNNLAGILPSSLTQLSSLERIDLSDNLLSGEIPSFPQKSLTSITFSSNNFDGAIPSILFSLPGLKKLYLNENSLTGKIISQEPVDKKSPLKELDLSLNFLSGPLSSFDFMFYPELQTMSVANNSLTGAIPAGLQELTKLQTINVSNNYFSGYVGDWICAVSFDLSHNHFYCPLPDCCQIEEIGDNQKQATGSDVRLCSSCTDISFRSSSSGTPIALIVGLCVGGGVLLLLIIAGIVFYCWRKSRKDGFTELNMTEVEMVEDLLRDSDEEVGETDDTSDVDFNFDSDSDCSDGIEY